MLNAHGEYLTRKKKFDFILYHTSKYDSGLLFGLDLVVAFVDLVMSIRTHLLNYELIFSLPPN